MKDIKEYVDINESQTKPNEITNYGRTWLSEWGPIYCGNILSWYIKGVKEGMNKYKADDAKFQKRCEDCIDKLLEIINKDIY